MEARPDGLARKNKRGGLTLPPFKSPPIGFRSHRCHAKALTPPRGVSNPLAAPGTIFLHFIQSKQSWMTGSKPRTGKRRSACFYQNYEKRHDGLRHVTRQKNPADDMQTGFFNNDKDSPDNGEAGEFTPTAKAPPPAAVIAATPCDFCFPFHWYATKEAAKRPHPRKLQLQGIGIASSTRQKVPRR